MKKQLSAVLAVAALVVLAACGSTPTGSDAAAPSRLQTDELVQPSDAPTPQDTTAQRVPNLFGSGN